MNLKSFKNSISLNLWSQSQNRLIKSKRIKVKTKPYLIKTIKPNRRSKRQWWWIKIKIKNKPMMRKKVQNPKKWRKLSLNLLSKKSHRWKVKIKRKKIHSQLKMSSQVKKSTKQSHQPKESLQLIQLQPKTQANKSLRREAKPKTFLRERSTQKAIRQTSKVHK